LIRLAVVAVGVVGKMENGLIVFHLFHNPLSAASLIQKLLDSYRQSLSEVDREAINAVEGSAVDFLRCW